MVVIWNWAWCFLYRGSLRDGSLEVQRQWCLEDIESRGRSGGTENQEASVCVFL